VPSSHTSFEGNHLVFSRNSFRAKLAVFALLFALIANVTPASAQASTSLSGTVSAGGNPAANVTVTVSGNNLTLHTSTDAQGHFSFNALTVGTYTVSVPGSNGPVSTQVDLTSSGAAVTLDTAGLKQIGKVTVARSPVSRASGTDVTINQEQLSRAAASSSLSDILVQLPSAARGSNGQIHINGDHNGLDYVIDGIEIPEGLNRVVGNEIEPANIGFVEILEGAYPAQFGDRFAAVVNISTKSQTGPAAGNIDLRGGSYSLFDAIVSAHTPVGDGGSLYVGTRSFRDGRALDPPVPDAVHDAGSTASQFLRLSLPVHTTDTLTFDLTHSLQTYQVPPDTSSGTPAMTDDDEVQEDTFASLIYRHAFGDRGVLSFGPSYKRSRILDTNDPGNDLIGQIAGPDAAPCSTFADCGFFSVFADRTDVNYRFNTDFVMKLGAHELRAGGVYGAETLQKNYVMTVPATDPAGAVLTPFTVTDTAPNVGHTEEFYVQDGWLIDPHWRLDYGARADAFQLFSTDFNNGFFQVSPRVKLTHIFNPKTSVYAYFGRLFEPFSLESVSPVASAALFGAAVVPGATNDLRPERDSLYELGGHFALGMGDVGVRISHRLPRRHPGRSDGPPSRHQLSARPRRFAERRVHAAAAA
jgi:hypothetical protein